MELFESLNEQTLLDYLDKHGNDNNDLLSVFDYCCKHNKLEFIRVIRAYIGNSEFALDLLFLCKTVEQMECVGHVNNINENIDFQYADVDDVTVLEYHICNKSDDSIIIWLLTHGVMITENRVKMAVKNGMLDIIEFYMQRSLIDINYIDSTGKSYLHGLCAEDTNKRDGWIWKEMLTYFFENGFNQIDAGKEETVLYSAVKKEMGTEIYELILSKGKAKVSFDLLLDAIDDGNLELIELFLKYNAINVYELTSSKEYLVEYAMMNAYNHDYAIATLFIEHGSLFFKDDDKDYDRHVSDFLGRFPNIFLKCFYMNLSQEFHNEWLRDDVSEKTARKNSMDYGNDIQLLHLFDLPYHRVTDGLHEFMKHYQDNEFFNMNGCDTFVDNIKILLQHINRVAHESSVGQAQLAEAAEADVSQYEPNTKKLKK